MTDLLFDIVFTGKLAGGIEPSAVKQKVAQLFKLDTEKVDRLFQGKPVTLKKNLEQVAAKKYQKILMQIGMVVELRQQHSMLDVGHQQPQPPFKAHQQRERPNSGRLALSVSKPEGYIGQLRADPSKPIRPLAPGISAQTLLRDFPPVETWTLDAPGTRLSPLSQTSAASSAGASFDVMPQQGNILRPDEVPPLVIADIDFSILDSLSVNAAGEYLILEDEYTPPQQREIDTSHLSVAPAEGYLLKESERPALEPARVYTGDLSLE